MIEKHKRPRVVIVGAGFGGLSAARRLDGEPVQVRLIDRNNYHLFQPLLYQVATAGLEPEQIAKPVRAILRGQDNLTFQMGEVRAIDLENQRISLADDEVEFDYLIIAVGAETNFFGLDQIAQHALGLKDLEDGVHIRNHVLSCFEKAALESNTDKRRELLTFMVVGGGPTGVEMAGALSELIHLVLIKDYPELSNEKVDLLLIEAEGQLLPGFPPKLAKKAEQELRDKGVDVRLATKITAYNGSVAETNQGEKISGASLIWSAGVKAKSLVQSLGLPLGHAGRIRVEPTLQLPGYPQVYVVGDAAYMEYESQPMPMMAPVAIQMAERAAGNILRQIEGEITEEFQYRDPGSLATIGRNSAVASVRGLNFSGFIAWIVWLVVHLIQLIGFRNRMLVLINWAWDYFFYDRAVRLITEDPAGGH